MCKIMPITPAAQQATSENCSDHQPISSLGLVLLWSGVGVLRIELQDTSKLLGVTPECSCDLATGRTVGEGRTVVVCTLPEQQ